jgi:glycosyltransferase involved in cell wall biosynthesis
MSERNDELIDVSVVIPVHNGAATVRSAIASALDQEGPTVEVVVVDDGSTDETAAVVSSLRDSRVSLVQQLHAGVSSARNTGAAAAAGRRLIFLDADDELLPGALLALNAPGDDVGLIVGRIEFFTRGSPDHTTGPPHFGALVSPMLSGSFAVDAAVFGAVGGYDERLGFSENTDLGIRVLAACRSRGRSVRGTERVVLRARSVRQLERHAAYAERILAASKVFFGKHRAVLDRERLTTPYAAAAGVAAARLRRWREAREWFTFAVKSPGRRASDAVRWAVSWVPLVRQRAWPQPSERGRARSRNHS